MTSSKSTIKKKKFAIFIELFLSMFILKINKLVNIKKRF